MSAPPSERSLLDRYLAAVPFVVAALALLSLLFWQAAIRKSPTVFTDELEWSQLSRAIADSGHAARRGTPFAYKSLYAYLIAPGWWIHSTSSAYAAIKYLNTIVMSLTAVPVYLLARTLVSKRIAAIAALASLCTTALYYAPFLLPEVLAYPTFVLCAYVSIRALAGRGRWWIAAAIVLDLIATRVRGELIVVPAAFAIAAAILWIVGPHGQRLRRNWGVLQYAGATLLVVAALLVLHKLAIRHSHEWAEVSANWMNRLWSLGMQATQALALGLGLLPLVGGLASLWIPERRADPNWRAFAAFLGAAALTVWMYTAVKAAYLSTIFATRVEERNMIYLGPLLIVGTAAWLTTPRKWLPGSLAALAFTAWLVLYYGYQLDYPYFEAPGYGIADMANRAWHFNQPTIRLGLAAACLVLLALILTWTSRVPLRIQRVTLLIASGLALSWMLAGEITISRGSAITSKNYVANLPQPPNWVDLATHGGGTTFIGQSISSGDALGVNLLEFWNRSVKNIWSIDGSAPGPGPTLTPDLSDRYGTLTNDPGLPYVLTTDLINPSGRIVARRNGLTLRRVDHHPWRLRDAAYGVAGDGWITGSRGIPYADGTYAYFGPDTKRGTLTVIVGRRGFCPANVAGTYITVQAGPVALNEQKAPYVAHASWVKRFLLANCTQRVLNVRIAPPFAVHVHSSSTFQLIDYGGTDPRMLGATVAFMFQR